MNIESFGVGSVLADQRLIYSWIFCSKPDLIEGGVGFVVV